MRLDGGSAATATRCYDSLVRAIVMGTLLATAPAEPSEPRELLVAPIRFETDLPDYARAEIDAGLQGGISRSGVNVVRVDEAATCENAACYTPLATKYGNRHFLQTTIVSHERDHVITMKLVDAEGAVVVSRPTTCDLCGVSELVESTNNLAASMANIFARMPRGPGFVTFKTQPEGASIFIDDQLVGTSPLRLEVAPGVHKLTVRSEGHGDLQRTIEGESGVEEELQLRLEPVDPFGEDRRIARPIGWTLLGLGIAGVAAGAAVWSLHGDPYNPSCTADEPQDLGGHCPKKYDTQAGGIIGVVLGGVAFGAGVGLVVWDAKRHPSRKRKDGGASAHLRVRPTATGLAVRF